MWPRTDFLELLGIAHPIVQAPMSGVTTPALAAAVCNVGGLGSIGCATLPTAAIREQVAAIGQATNRPFNLNFFVHAPPVPAPETTAATPLMARRPTHRALRPAHRRLQPGEAITFFQRHLAVLVGQGPWRETARQPGHEIIASEQGRQHVTARASCLLADR